MGNSHPESWAQEAALSADERRARYACGTNFVAVDQIPTWKDYAPALPPPGSEPKPEEKSKEDEKPKEEEKDVEKKKEEDEKPKEDEKDVEKKKKKMKKRKKMMILPLNLANQVNQNLNLKIKNHLFQLLSKLIMI